MPSLVMSDPTIQFLSKLNARRCNIKRKSSGKARRKNLEISAANSNQIAKRRRVEHDLVLFIACNKCLDCCQ